MRDTSKLRVYSVGIVAANKPLSSKDIEVTPIEDTALLDGELSDNVVPVSSKATDASGSAYETRIATTTTIKATWLPLQGSGNRLTAPDVRRGERVIIYRFADEDRFWWVTQGQDMRLRKLETVIWGISATPDEGAEPNAGNMYWIEFSSHKKLIHLHTGCADGEPYAYDVQINTKDGLLIIQDDDGQQFSLDSRERTWQIINRDGSKVEVNKREIYHEAPDLIRLKAKDIQLQAGNNISSDAGNNISSQAGVKIEETAGTEITAAAPNTHITSQVQLVGGQRISGKLNVAGSMRSSTGGNESGGIGLEDHVHREQGDFELVSLPIDSATA